MGYRLPGPAGSTTNSTVGAHPQTTTKRKETQTRGEEKTRKETGR